MEYSMIPYDGNEPYIYVDCCDTEFGDVQQLLEQLGYDGYRFWYDDSTEMTNGIEKQLERLHHCSAVLAIISNGFTTTHKCRWLMNVALESKKEIYAVVLRNVSVPVSLTLQLEHHCRTYKWEQSGAVLLLKQIYESTVIASCKGESSYYRHIMNKTERSNRMASVNNTPVAAPGLPLRNTDNPAKCTDKLEQNASVSQDILGQSEIPILMKTAAEQCSDKHISDQDDVTVFEVCDDEQTSYDDIEDESEKTTLNNIYNNYQLLLFRLSDETCFIIDSALTRLGRSEKKCDVVLANNSSISNYHADIIQYNGICYLRDAESANGTFLEGEKIEKNDRKILPNLSTFQLSDETFQLVYGKPAERLLNLNHIVLLINTKNQEKQFVAESEILLDRHHVWKGGTFQDNKISRIHARLFYQDNNVYVEDSGSTNGTYINGEKISSHEPVAVIDGTYIKIGNTILQVKIKRMQEIIQQ